MLSTVGVLFAIGTWMVALAAPVYYVWSSRKGGSRHGSPCAAPSVFAYIKYGVGATLYYVVVEGITLAAGLGTLAAAGWAILDFALTWIAGLAIVLAVTLGLLAIHPEIRGGRYLQGVSWDILSSLWALVEPRVVGDRR